MASIADLKERIDRSERIIKKWKAELAKLRGRG